MQKVAFIFSNCVLTFFLVFLALFNFSPTFALTISSTPHYSHAFTYNNTSGYWYEYDATVDSLLTDDAVSATYISSTNKSLFLSYWVDNHAEQETFIADNYNVTKLADASKYYNCHSYAWLCNDTDYNSFWVDNPINFYTDNSYYEVSSPTLGDIICYLNNSNIIHSGIIVGITNYYNSATGNLLLGDIDKYIVDSKWGENGLYRHTGYECPYTSFIADHHLYDDLTPYATSVKYFRRQVPLVYTQYNDYQHTYSCGLGHTHYESHTWTLYLGNGVGDQPMYFTMYQCTKCGALKFGNMF